MTDHLPPDDHVHSEWSWDAAAGSMEGSCARAVELGLPAIAFTEHFDHTRWVTPPEVEQQFSEVAHLVEDGRFDPPPLDTEGYLEELDRCRSRFPDLRIVTGVEIGEPHWFPDEVGDLLDTGAFERVLGSQHSFRVDGEPWLAELGGVASPSGLTPHEIVRAHLVETHEMVVSCDRFAVLAHIDYAARYWPDGPERFPVGDFEDEIRAVLEAVAASGRTLEVNTAIPLDAEIIRWWREHGGGSVSFGSDAHQPGTVGRRFDVVVDMVESIGFRPGAHPYDLWRR